MFVFARHRTGKFTIFVLHLRPGRGLDSRPMKSTVLITRSCCQPREIIRVSFQYFSSPVINGQYLSGFDLLDDSTAANRSQFCLRHRVAILTAILRGK